MVQSLSRGIPPLDQFRFFDKRQNLGRWAARGQRNNFRPTRFSLSCPVISAKTGKFAQIDTNGCNAFPETKKRTWKQHTLGRWATSRQRDNFRPSRFSLNCPIISTKSENVTKIDENGLKALQNNPDLGSGRSRKSGRHRGSEIIFLQRVFR